MIEDSCHAFGAEYHGEKIGSLADLTAFSFHPVKHITTGEGGLAATNNKDYYNKLLLLRTHGIEKNISKEMPWLNDMKMLGKNYRITDFQCALGISQLKRAEEMIRKRSRIAAVYNEELKRFKELALPSVKKDVRHAWHIYPVLLDRKLDRNTFIRIMREQNIGVDVHYIPIYHFSYYKKFGADPSDFPVTEDIFKRTVTLPIFPEMGDEDVKDVISAVEYSLNQLRQIV